MQSQPQHLISLLRTIILAGVTGLLITSAALPLPAQNSVPATAAQAARMPQFASRLAHPATSRMPVKSPASVPSNRRQHSLGEGGGIAYENGPVNGQIDAWTLNFGFATTDTIQAGGGVTGVNFWAWLIPGDTITSVQVSIGSSPFGSDQFDGVVSLTQSNCFTNDFGYNVCLESGNFNGANGDGWLTLQNATVPSGDPVYWDENSGVGCQSPGCPSQAQENSVGTIPSEAFTIQGQNNPPPECFNAYGNLQVLANFTQQQAGTTGQDGVVLDRAGNLYGAFPNGGDNSAGFVFKLTHYTDWLLNPLFSFLGGANGSKPTGLIVGPNGSLYGGAQGGIQNCGTNGSQYCGIVFNLTPPATTCRTALCSWNQNTIYRFSGEMDGAGIVNLSAYDQQGNLYGTTTTGGVYDFGTVFELTPSPGGWTKTTLYSFSPDNNPIQVLVGNDGNLYGVTNSDVENQSGFVFQLVPSGGQWTLNLLEYYNYGGPHYLGQDSYGNLYGITPQNGVVFAGLKDGSGWDWIYYGVSFPGTINNLTVDANGNTYGTGLLTGQGLHDPLVFKAWVKYFGWYVESLQYFGYESFPSGGALALDTTNGNLYGTTNGCGAYNSGTVWQVLP
jgi:uncharacterized repeat protein (TIGR03803 family)